MATETPNAPPRDLNALGRVQHAYWTRVATTKTFGHPLQHDWLATHGLDASSRILDLGCGYGRVTAELAARGHQRIVGVDSSAGMLARARSENRGPGYVRAESLRLPFADASFDAALLLAVLTCIPDRGAQATLLSELSRVLAPGGLLFVSDLPLQPDVRNRARYAAGETRYGSRGVFELDEGVVLTHLEEAWLDRLLAGFDPLERAEVALATMNGNPALAEQRLVRKR